MPVRLALVLVAPGGVFRKPEDPLAERCPDAHVPAIRVRHGRLVKVRLRASVRCLAGTLAECDESIVIGIVIGSGGGLGGGGVGSTKCTIVITIKQVVIITTSTIIIRCRCPVGTLWPCPYTAKARVLILLDIRRAFNSLIYIETGYR